MHGPEQPILGHDQVEPNQSRNDVEEIEVMDMDNTPSSGALDSSGGSNPKAIPMPTANGLIKMQWPTAVRVPCFGDLEYELFDFCKWISLHLARADTFPDVNCICAGRTILKDNAYLNEFLPILHSNGRTINPVLALSASYHKEYFDEGSCVRKQIEYAEYRYSMETAKEVREAVTRGDVGAPTAVAAALLSHHATLNPSLHPCCWTKYLYPMLDPAGAEVEANLAMASVAILAMTALPLNGKRNFQHINYNWIGRGEAMQLTKVNSTLGLSRMMLYFIHSITQEAKVCTLKTRGPLTDILRTLTNRTRNVFCEKLKNPLSGWMKQKVICQDISHWELRKRIDLERSYTVLLGFTGMALFSFLDSSPNTSKLHPGASCR